MLHNKSMSYVIIKYFRFLILLYNFLLQGKSLQCIDSFSNSSIKIFPPVFVNCFKFFKFTHSYETDSFSPHCIEFLCILMQ